MVRRCTVTFGTVTYHGGLSVMCSVAGIRIEVEGAVQGYVLTRYKRPMELREVPKPTAGNGELLIRVRAAGLNPTDYKIRDGMARAFLALRLARGGG